MSSSLRNAMATMASSGAYDPSYGSHYDRLSHSYERRPVSPSPPLTAQVSESGSTRVPIGAAAGRSDSPAKAGGSIRVPPASQSPAGAAVAAAGGFPSWTLAAKYGVFKQPDHSVEVPATTGGGSVTLPAGGVRHLYGDEPDGYTRETVKAARVLGTTTLQGTTTAAMTPLTPLLLPSAEQSAAPSTGIQSVQPPSVVTQPGSFGAFPRTSETAAAVRAVPMAVPMMSTAPGYLLPSIAPVLVEAEAAPEEVPEPLVQMVWDGHLDAFLRRDLARLLTDYDDSSHIRLYNDADGTKIDCIGVCRIAQMYGELLADLLGTPPEASVVDVDEVAGSVFFVWNCPNAGVLAATSTYIFAHTMKIWRQNMVLTKVPRNEPPRRPASISSQF